jgi:long-chain fatty acid transport protein
MIKKTAVVLGAVFVSSSTFAGGILTNTNQSAAFDRMMSRDASIAIDGVYSNPAGVTFLSPGSHLSLNVQTAFQSRIIKNTYPLFANNTENPSSERTYKGEAFAPVIPSIQYAYNWRKFSFQGSFALVGGGGKCTFDDGLGSFERIVANTGIGLYTMANQLDATQQLYGMGGTALPSLLPNGTYSFDSYMRGRQYYYGLSLGMGYKPMPNLAVFVGVRGVYASSHYYGYVKNIKVGNVLLNEMLPGGADIELNCDQNGLGFTPILGVDYKVGRFNLAAKYEFKTRMRLKNQSVNRTPSIAGLGSVLVAAGVNQNLLASEAVQGQLTAFTQKFDNTLDESIGEYADGTKIKNDIPALLTLGVGYNPIDPLTVNVGFHYFFDKQASSYNNRQEKLRRGTIEYNAGVQYDINKTFSVSCGWQNTSYGLTEEYMDDKSFVVSSNSVGGGLCIHATPKLDVNVGYFHTFYKNFSTSEVDTSTNQTYTAEYTRNNNVFSVGVDFTF